MTRVRAVGARLVDAAWAPDVVSPLHDVLTLDERRAILARNPHSFLHVTSDPLALPDPPGDQVQEAVQARALQRLVDQGAYRDFAEPGVYVYSMRQHGAEHTGVVAGVAVASFLDGGVLGHEQVQPARVDGLVLHYGRVPQRSEVVALVHRSEPSVRELTERVRRTVPLLDFTDAEGLTQTVWRAAPEDASALTDRLGGLTHYIADGHHRVAAAVRCWERDGRPDTPVVLCAFYPEDQVELEAFHRRVCGPVSVAALLADLDREVLVEGATEPGVRPGSVGLYAAGGWRVLTRRDRRAAPGLAGLDVTWLHERVLGPLLGVVDGDPRLEFVPERRDLDEPLKACDADGGVLFTLHAPGLDDLVEVAERREFMSAKTTYVTPKPRTGVFLL